MVLGGSMSANNASENHGINVYVWVAIVSIPFLICIFHKPIFDGIKRCLRKSRKHNNAAMNLTNKVSGAVYAASHSLGNRAEAKVISTVLYWQQSVMTRLVWFRR
tara:strand:+ start:1343 stop:1657 length:315 start_codon:yes stop_codon:yes gene_type:complete